MVAMVNCWIGTVLAIGHPALHGPRCGWMSKFSSLSRLLMLITFLFPRCLFVFFDQLTRVKREVRYDGSVAASIPRTNLYVRIIFEGGFAVYS